MDSTLSSGSALIDERSANEGIRKKPRKKKESEREDCVNFARGREERSWTRARDTPRIALEYSRAMR